MQACKSLKHDSIQRSSVWSAKLWENGCFVMGDVDLQVELTLNEKEILSYLYDYRIMFIAREVAVEEHMARSSCFSH